jgi:hypothetical protein
MAPRKHPRTQDPRIYSAQTGEDIYEGEDAVASDLAVRSGSTTVPQVGRTPSDLLHEGGFSRAVSKFFQELDPVELLFIGAYVVLSGWGSSQHPIWPFQYFGLSILGYHVIGRPIASGLMSWSKTWFGQARSKESI